LVRGVFRMTAPDVIRTSHLRVKADDMGARAITEHFVEDLPASAETWNLHCRKAAALWLARAIVSGGDQRDAKPEAVSELCRRILGDEICHLLGAPQ
jgi:hypothetical protein